MSGNGYKLGEIIEENGKKYVMTTEGLIPISSRAKPRAIFEEPQVLKAFRTGNKTIIELVKTIAKRGTENTVLYVLRKKIELKDRTIIAKAVAVPEEIAKKLFKF